MKLDPTISKVEVFYDGNCGMCRKFSAWLETQEHFNTLICLPYQAEETLTVFPDIGKYDPAKQLVVRTDDNAIYQGAKSWIWCLWSCVNYRDLASILNNRLLLPIAKKACYFLSANRLRISQLIFGQPSDEFVEMKFKEEDSAIQTTNHSKCCRQVK